MPITHAFTSAIDDGVDDTLIQPSDWNAAHVGGLDNPMTTAGDLIYGGASGTATRLAAGTEGYVLTMGATNPAWAAVGSTQPALKVFMNLNFK
jgi:hypothetical protein